MSKSLAHLVTASCLLVACGAARAQPVGNGPAAGTPPQPAPALEPVTFTGSVPMSLRAQMAAQKSADAVDAKARADAAAQNQLKAGGSDGTGMRPVEAADGGSNVARTSLEFRELKRVESFVADIGPLGTSGRQQDASLRVPNDFGGLYQIPKDANTPYAGWFARRRGGLTAVFPKGDYIASKEGLSAMVPANTTYIMGAIQTGLAQQPAQNRSEPSGLFSTRQGTGVSTKIDSQLTTRISDESVSLLLPAFGQTGERGGADGWGPGSPRPDPVRAAVGESGDAGATVETAAMDAIFSGGLARSVRLAELGRAAGIKRLPAADSGQTATDGQVHPAVTTGQK